MGTRGSGASTPSPGGESRHENGCRLRSPRFPTSTFELRLTSTVMPLAPLPGLIRSAIVRVLSAQERSSLQTRFGADCSVGWRESRVLSSAVSAPAAARVLVVEASRGWPRLDLGELWAYRELLAVFVWRDLKVRYRQTLLGAAWVIGQPLVSMAIFTVIFHRVARFEAHGGVPYALFVLCGLLPWNLLAAGVQGAGNSLIHASHLVSKIYFPRLLLPLGAVLVPVVDLTVAALLVAAALAYYAVTPPTALALVPLAVALGVLLALGVGVWLAALNVRYRDVRVLIPFLLQVWMYATPVVYPLEVLPERAQALVRLNPATGVVELFRACVLGTPLAPGVLAPALAGTLLVATSGILAFRRGERTLADLL